MLQSSPDTLTPALTPAANRLLAAASDLFYVRGIHAVGVDLIAETAGTTKKTLYDRFGSKEGLVTAYLSARRARWTAYVEERLGDSRATGVERVLVVLDALEEWVGDLERGCGFVNAWAELGGTAHAGVAEVHAEKEWVRDLYVRLVAEEDLGGSDGAETRGSWLALLHEGAVVGLTAGGRAGAVEDARAATRRLLSG